VGSRRRTIDGVRGAAVALAFLVATASSGAARPPPGSWSQLRRSLHLPVLSPGELCPVSNARPRHGLAGALGADPPFPLQFPQAIADLGRATPRNDARYAYPARWLAPPRFAGRVLVRSRRLDRPATIGFSKTAHGRRLAELKLSFAASPRWRTRGRAYVLVPSPGCYGFQVDGLDFSNAVVFAARLGP
jgi:hypothetical protein